MNKKELKEIIAIELWVQFTKAHNAWQFVSANSKKSWYERAEQFIERTKLDSLVSPD